MSGNLTTGRRSLPSLNALRAFEAVGRLGRMTLAAAELGVTHGAVSRQVRLLEEAVGTPLLEGPKAASRPTAAGRELLASLGPAFDLIEAGVGRVGQAATRVPVACHSTLITKWLIPRLHRFRTAHPDVDVELREMAAADMFVPGAKVSVRLMSGALPGPYVTAAFMPIDVGPVLSPDLAAGAADLLRLPRLVSSSWPQGWSRWAELSGREIGAASTEQVFGRMHYMLGAAIAGLGVAIASWPFVADDIAAGRLVAPFGFVRTPDAVAAITPAGGTDRATRRFLDWLRAEAAAMMDTSLLS